jgi:hypothetical protein
VQEFKRNFVALFADKVALACLPDVITTHVHAVIPAVKHFAAFTFPAYGAHKRVSWQCILPGRQQDCLEPSQGFYNIFNPLFKYGLQGEKVVVETSEGGIGKPFGKAQGPPSINSGR